MKTNTDYIRSFLGDREEETPLFSDAEISALLLKHLHRRITPRLSGHLAARGVDCTEVDNAGLLRITLRSLANMPGAYDSGVGHWLESSCAFRLDGTPYEPVAGDDIDYVSGTVTLETPPAEGARLTVDTYLVDIKVVLTELLQILRSSRARLALKANLSGVSIDLTEVSRRLKSEIEELGSGYEMPHPAQEDYPH
jgi:hypothetical protein